VNSTTERKEDEPFFLLILFFYFIFCVKEEHTGDRKVKTKKANQKGMACALTTPKFFSFLFFSLRLLLLLLFCVCVVGVRLSGGLYSSIWV
jgi:hypothetical protein